MGKFKGLSGVFQSAKEVLFDDESRFIIMSDCHRGYGDWADTFSKNQNIFFAALNHYYHERYTYIELGDGDELWQNRRLSEIIREHSDIFWLMSEFFSKDRLYFIYGNHDIVKRDNEFTKNNLYYYYNERENQYLPLFENIQVHEGLVLKHRITGDKIFLIHGHQVDFFNNEL